MAADDTIRSPHATLPWRKSARKAGSTAKPPSNPTYGKITLSPPPPYRAPVSSRLRQGWKRSYREKPRVARKNDSRVALRASSRTGWTLQAPNWLQTHDSSVQRRFTKRILTAKHDPAALRCRIAPECICAEALPLPHGARRSRRQTMQSSNR